MADRMQGQTFFPIRFWPVIVLSILIVGILFVFVGSSLGLLGQIPQQILGIPQAGDDRVTATEIAPTGTPLPSPTPTDLPSTETPTRVPSPTKTPTVTPTPFPTPVITPWTYLERRIFVGYGAGEIFKSLKFRSTFPCEKQGKAWSDNADPFVVEYLSGVIEYCVCEQVSSNVWIDVTDEGTLEEIRQGNIEVILEAQRILTSEIGDFSICPNIGDFEIFDYLYNMDVSEWEWALFVERNYRVYGWWDWSLFQGPSGLDRTQWVKDYLEINFGNPLHNPYSPNFDKTSPYYQFESRRLGLLETEE